MATPKDKKKIKGFKEFDAAKYIELEPTIDEAVGRDTVVFTFGRMNPMTIGHEKLAQKVVVEAKNRNGEPMIFLSHSSGAKTKSGKGSENKDPLSYDDKIKYASKAFGPIVKKSPLKVLILIVKSLQGKYKNLVMVAGSDRVAEYDTLLKKYNGKDYKFDSIEVVSAGQRDADGEGASGMSGTKMREFAVAGDLKKFTSGLPKNIRSSAGEIMDKVSQAINESEKQEADRLDEALNRMQRRKRGLAMRKARFKIARGREKAKKRTASQEVLKKRAGKAAINVFKKKFTKNRRYADLSAGEKEVVDKRIEKISKNRIQQIARKLLPKVKQKERERRKKHMAGGSTTTNTRESITEASYKDQRILKRPHMLLSGDKKPKLDGRFKMFKKKATNESIDYVTEVADLMEATEQFHESTMSAVKKPITVTGPDGKTRTVMKTTKNNRTDDHGQDILTKREQAGAGEEGTDALVKRLKKDTPVSEANKITKRLKTLGVDLDKRAKDRKAEHDRLKKQYALEEAAMKKGDKVRIIAKYCDSEAEKKLVFEIEDLRGPRVLIRPVDWKRGIAPTESLLMTMIEPAK
tara:strand:- start:3274 stop:5007 length:1734 start_codon:yes stop_codon:yes gene_type:complete